MSDLPARVHIHEEGPREGFQIEPGPISTEDKVRFIEALAGTGLREIECVSFVNPRRVPGQADAEDVARWLKRRPGVRYTCLWLNLKGLERAVASGLDLAGRLLVGASEPFTIRNAGMDLKAELGEQKRWLAKYRELGLAVEQVALFTAFGCNFAGDVTPERVVEVTRLSLENAAEAGFQVGKISLADTVGWATPRAVERVVGAVRQRWPDKAIALHLHDTRGVGLANAYAGLKLGVAHFDSSCGGLGGCPFAGHKGAAGNICTEDLVFMCEEMGIDTGVDLDRLIACAQLAEKIVGHPLPGKVMRGGGLGALRARLKAAE
ncbi:MAG: hydroxymethylglutaryl-CoA lyase [Alphaproteobacteria bacterium]|nr:hydroxymethylglutaryl-CoA lyase [Alphaproteobacteria bacterium]